MVRLGRSSVALDPTATTGDVATSIGENRENEINSVVDVLESRLLHEQVVEQIGAEIILQSGQGKADSRLSAVQSKLSAVGDWLEQMHITDPLSNFERAVQRLQKGVQVHRSKDSSVISIEYAAANPLMMALLNVLTPHAAAAFATGGRPRLQRVVHRATAAVLILMAPICAVIAFAGDPLLTALFGAAYSGSGGVLLVLIVAQSLNYLALAPGRGLLVLERSRDCLLADLAFTSVSITATLALIEPLDIWGAALAMLGANAVLVTLMAWRYAVRLAEFDGALPLAADPGPADGAGVDSDLPVTKRETVLKAV